VEPSSAPWRLLEPSEPEAAAPQAAPHPVSWPVVGAAILAVAVATGAFLLASRSEPVIGVDGATTLDSASGGPAEAAGGVAVGGGPQLVVEVGGAVARPGVYRLPPGSRVGDAIAAAGGFSARVDAASADARLNLAAALRDGDEVHVPSRDEAAAGGSGDPATGGAGGGPGGGLVDLNSATAEQLDALPGVGPATAAKIIAAREEQRFTDVEDLRTRKVLGAATLEKIRALVTVGR
jgi:competence protein ComEA